jgi:glycosyltransferase involved in cell wall biosynthesis
MTGRPKLLHIFPTFDFGGMELRVITIMNALGERACHTVLPLDGRYEAAVRVKPPAALRIVPPPSGKGGLFYAMALRSVVSDIRPDLVLTYNWGAMDAVVGVGFKPLCPVIHNECGFGAEESEKLRFRRVVARRIALNRIFRTVVVSRSMLTVAREQFKVRPDKLRFIQTGVDVEGFQPGRHGTWRERRSIKPEEIVVGFVGGLRPEKNLGLLLRAYAASDLRNARLALIGDGPCRAELEDLAEKLGIRGKTIFEGRVTDVRESLAGMDVFVMSSATEQTPNALLEATGLRLAGVGH